MAFFKLKKTEAEQAQQRYLKELERVAKAQRKQAAKEHKAAKRREQKAQKEAKQAHKAVQKSHRRDVKQAKKATKSRIRLARKAEKDRVRRARREAAAVAAGGVVAPPLTKSSGCYVCGKKFGQALHRRRHHCRQCRESCCLQCTSSTRRPVPLYGLHKPQKVCVVCETLVLNNENVAARSQPREPAEAVAALAASGRASRRPHSAPLPPTTGVTVSTRSRERGRTRSTKSKGGSIWTLPIRPLLKRKKSAEQLRNRKLDRDLQVEKRALFESRGVELQPQAIAPPAP